MQRLLDSIRPDAVMILGDDVSDADAFRVVVAAREGGIARRGLPALVIAVHGAAETPAEVVRAADLLVAAPRDAARALAELARVLTAEFGIRGRDPRVAAPTCGLVGHEPPRPAAGRPRAAPEDPASRSRLRPAPMGRGDAPRPIAGRFGTRFCVTYESGCW